MGRSLLRLRTQIDDDVITSTAFATLARDQLSNLVFFVLHCLFQKLLVILNRQHINDFRQTKGNYIVKEFKTKI